MGGSNAMVQICTACSEKVGHERGDDSYLKPLVTYRAPCPMLYFALSQTALGPSTMAKKAYVNFGFLQVHKGTILLSFSSFAGVMAAKQHIDTQ